MATLNDILVSILISDVELCYIETLSFSQKFNLVLLYKDLRQKSVDGLDNSQLEDIKKQLSANKIQLAEGLPLNWWQIMRAVRENPGQFREAGGWDFLTTASRNTELVIKMEPSHSLSCCCCDQLVGIRKTVRTALIVLVKVPPDHDDIEQRNYVFYCSNCRQSATQTRQVRKETREDSSSTINQVENEEAAGRKEKSSSGLLVSQAKNSVERNSEKERNPAPSSSSSQPGQKISQRKTQEVSEGSNQSQDKKDVGPPPVKKSRMVLTEGRQRLKRSNASPELRSVSPTPGISRDQGEEEGNLMKINNNVQDPRIQQDNAMREDKGDPACVKTPPSSQPPTQQEDGGGRKKKPNMPRSYHLELVVHASYCNAPDCPQYRCRMMKKRLAHMRRQKGDTGDCRDCKVCPAMIRLLTDHAKLCPVRKTNYISSVGRGRAPKWKGK